MRILAIDHGDKRFGLAVSDPLHLVARPLGSYSSRGRKADRQFFADLAREHEIGRIVIGLPLMMNGRPGTQVDKVRKFGSWLEKALDLPVVYWDERLTTKEALDLLRSRNLNPGQEKRYKDQIAAAIILTAYLEGISGRTE